MAPKRSAKQNDSSTPMLSLSRRYNSQESLGRYSEPALHSAYLGRYGGGECIRKIL
jgi:hypothetical protein